MEKEKRNKKKNNKALFISIFWIIFAILFIGIACITHWLHPEKVADEIGLNFNLIVCIILVIGVLLFTEFLYIGILLYQINYGYCSDTFVDIKYHWVQGKVLCLVFSVMVSFLSIIMADLKPIEIMKKILIFIKESFKPFLIFLLIVGLIILFFWMNKKIRDKITGD